MTQDLVSRNALLTIEEAAHALRISRAKLYQLIAAGDLTPVKIGRRRLFPPAEITRFVGQLITAAEQ